MSNQRIASFSYVLLSLVFLFVLGQMLEDAWGYFQLGDSMRVGQFGLPWIIAAVMTIPTWILLRGPRVNPFMLEVIQELKEVTWPTPKETISHTRVVIATVIVLAVVLGGFDFVWAKLSKLILNPSL